MAGQLGARSQWRAWRRLWLCALAVPAALAGWLLLAASLALTSPALASQPQSPRYEGVAACAGSTCHGRSVADGAVVRQDELAHWQDPASQAGAHARSYQALASARGMRIAASLGLGPATSASACLGCHATNAPPAQRGPRFQLADGVGCESCHGPASGWIASHYTLRASHAANVAAGMAALERPAVRAGVCLDCHFGSDQPGHFVTHQMMAAGHPRVSFELDLFSALNQHWNEDADYAARKGASDHARLWLVGQAEALRRQLALFANPRLASQGLYPEFYFFDCHSCHRAIDDNPARARLFEVNPGRPIGFGTPPFNDENLILLSAAGGALAPAQGAAFDAAARRFHAAMGQGRPETLAAAAALGKAAAALEAALASRPLGAGASFSLISAIGARATAQRFTDYEGAVQAVMAIDTLLNALVSERRITLGAAAGIRAHIEQAYGAVKTPAGFAPATFRAALGAAVSSIEALK